MKKISICAWGGAGKSVLLSLLDGHSQISISPMHEKVMFSLKARYDNERERNDVRPIIKDLVSGGYLSLLIQSIDNGFDVLLSSDAEDNIFVTTEFDFFSFERDWISNLLTSDTWDRETIVNLIYDSYFANLNRGSLRKHVASHGVHNTDVINSVADDLPDVKFIFLSRSIYGILSTKVNRKLPFSIHSSMSRSREIIFMILETVRVARFDAWCYRKATTRPDKYMCISFETLLTQNVEAMSEVCKFLDIEPEKGLHAPTLLGTPIAKNGKTYISTDHDVSKSEKNVLLRQIVNITYRFFYKISGLFQIA